VIKNIKLLEQFENDLMKKEKFSYKEALAIYEALWFEAKNLKVFPLKNPMEEINTEINIAKILNSCSKTS